MARGREKRQARHEVKHVILPSGKSVEVVYFRGDPHDERYEDRALHVCVGCGSRLVQPVDWEESGPDHWRVLLWCPNCELHREGVFSQAAVEELDAQLEAGAEQIYRDYRRLVRANMAEEAERFAEALHRDLILPEDF